MQTRAPRRVLYLQYTNPGHYPPLEHSAHLLADEGCDILMLGIGADDDCLTVRRHQHIDVRLLPIESPGWRQKVHYARFVVWAAAEARAFHPDWIYASDSLSCPAALALATVTGAEILYHEHDSPEPTAPPSSRFMRSVLAARRRVANVAALCVLPNAYRADVFREHTGASRVTTVWNTPLRSEITARAREGTNSDDRLRLWYHGSITPPNLPMAVVEALAQLPDTVTLDVVGYQTRGYEGYANVLRDTAARLGISHRVVVADAMPRVSLLAAATRADVGVALLPALSDRINERAMVGASNKPFDYMAAGLALLVPDAPAWRSTFVDAGFAVAGDPESAFSIAGAVQCLLQQRTALAEMGRRGQEQIAREWNYETTFAPVMARLMGRDRDSAARGAA